MRVTDFHARAVVLAITALMLSACGWAAQAAAPGRATVTVDGTRTVGTLAKTFTGLSFEASQLGQPASAQWNPTRGNYAALFRTLGAGVVRFGGNSLDRRTAWLPNGGPLPSWASVAVTPADLTSVAAFSRAVGWRVLLGINLGHFDAASAAGEARFAASAFGSQLAAFECGNEPNVFTNGLRPMPYPYTQYRAEWEACAATVAASGGAMAGPDTIGTAWTPGFVGDEHTRLALVTQHRYALSGCGAHAGTATIPALLSPATDASEVATLSTVTAAAGLFSLPVRLGETNSVSCGGQRGVSDVYASALWGLDYMLLMAQHGAAGVNFHTGSTSCTGYVVMCAASPANLAAGVMTPRPLYYGMLMFHLVGAGDLLPVAVAAGSANLTAYAIRRADGLTRVVLIDRNPISKAPVAITLHAGTGRGAAAVLHLTGTALGSAAGIAIQHATVDAAGNFSPGRPDQVLPSGGAYTVSLATGSVALITLR